MREDEKSLKLSFGLLKQEVNSLKVDINQKMGEICNQLEKLNNKIDDKTIF